MGEKRRDVCKQFLSAAMRALVRYCLRNGLRLQDIVECSKDVFVQEAARELEKSGEKVTISRVHLISGVHRKDITKLLRSTSKSQLEQSLVVKVMGRWHTDPKYLTKKKEPRMLYFEASDSEFRSLVASVSKELNPTSVLFELERVKAVKRRGPRLQLTTDTYVPSEDLTGILELVTTDSDALFLAVEENLFSVKNVPNLHARTEFDNIRPESLEKIRAWFVREGHLFHRKVRDYLSQFDQDINPDPKFKGRGRRVRLGTFSHIEEAVNEDEAQ